MWVVNKGWWGTWIILLAPGVVALVIGILHPGARTSDDSMTLRTFGIVWIFLQLLIMGVPPRFYEPAEAAGGLFPGERHPGHRHHPRRRHDRHHGERHAADRA